MPGEKIIHKLTVHVGLPGWRRSQSPFSAFPTSAMGLEERSRSQFARVPFASDVEDVQKRVTQ